MAFLTKLTKFMVYFDCSGYRELFERGRCSRKRDVLLLRALFLGPTLRCQPVARCFHRCSRPLQSVSKLRGDCWFSVSFEFLISCFVTQLNSLSQPRLSAHAACILCSDKGRHYILSEITIGSWATHACSRKSLHSVHWYMRLGSISRVLDDGKTPFALSSAR